MRLQSRWARLALMFAVLALLAVGCRGDEAADDAQDAVDDAVSDAEDTAEEAEETVDDAADEAEETADDAMEEDATEDDAAAAGDVAFDVGVTEEACPDAVNADNGCIYLGTISDLTVGPFAALAVPITDAQTAFWQRVNENGGVGGFDVNTSEFTRDNQYSPEVHSQQYEEIKNEVLALAQSLV